MVASHYPTAPSFFGIVFGVIFSTLAGAVLAAVHLMAKPVEVVSVEPKERLPGVVYFVSGTRGGDWERKVDALSASGVALRFSEGELAGWAERELERHLAERAGAQGASGSAEERRVLARGVNVRIAGEALQAGWVLSDAFGQKDRRLVFQMQGAFAKGLFGWEYRPETGYAGSLPLHKIPGAMLVGTSYVRKLAPELSKAESIAIGNGVLAVRMP